ncbi:MAG: hypothetical protein EOO88_12365 [Pedobacter sp.]|nr:MAG: hypothetical protein EOO88_12365 [Pedobacter sp.]
MMLAVRPDLLTFALKLRKKNLHINKILSFLLLGVFFIALTPWSSLHHHEEVEYTCKNEPLCGHKLHISSHAEQCLVCAAHFEKNFVTTVQVTHSFVTMVIFLKENAVHVNAYTALISTSLRGPPIA